MNFKDSELLVSKLLKVRPNANFDDEEDLEAAFFICIRDNTDEFKEQLRAVRKQHSKTQAEIAKFLGVTQAAYSGWESGSSFPKASSIKELAEYYDEDPSIFLSFINENDLEHTESVPVLVKEDLDYCSPALLNIKLHNIKKYFNKSEAEIGHTIHNKFLKPDFATGQFKKVPSSSAVDFFYVVPDDSMEPTVVKGSLVSVSHAVFMGHTDEQKFSRANNKVVLLSINEGPVMLRRVFFEGDLVTLTAANPNYASRSFPLDINEGVISSITDKGRFSSSNDNKSIILAKSITLLGIAKEMIVDLS